MVSLSEAQAVEATIAEASERLNVLLADAHHRGLDVEVEALPAGWDGRLTLVNHGHGTSAPKVVVEVRVSPCSLKA